LGAVPDPTYGYAQGNLLSTTPPEAASHSHSGDTTKEILKESASQWKSLLGRRDSGNCDTDLDTNLAQLGECRRFGYLCIREAAELTLAADGLTFWNVRLLRRSWLATLASILREAARFWLDRH
jgi:hypothetical protein